MNRGLFIDLEGIDASGKTTQLERLVKRMRAVEWVVEGKGVVSYGFPRYDTPIGHAIKHHPQLLYERYTRVAVPGVIREDDALSFESLMLADKVEAASGIEQALAYGTHVVTGRWSPSAIAYGSYSGHDPRWLERLYALVPQPDLVLLIDLDPEEAVRRRPEFRDRYESNRGRQHHVRKFFLGMCSRPGWILIDGSRSPDDVGLQIWSAVWPILSRRRSSP